MVFEDRTDAGRRLAADLADLREDLRRSCSDSPRGGVPVAAEVARGLGAPLEVLVVRKLGAPRQSRAGRRRTGGRRHGDHRQGHRRAGGDDRPGLEKVLVREERELHRQARLFPRRARPRRGGGRSVLVVDDGLATGLSDLAAVKALRDRGRGTDRGGGAGRFARGRADAASRGRGGRVPHRSRFGCSASDAGTRTSPRSATSRSSPCWRERALRPGARGGGRRRAGSLSCPGVVERRVPVNGIELAVVEEGEGPLVVLCHGFPELAFSWRHQLRALADGGYRVVVPDMRGYGRSSDPLRASRPTTSSPSAAT